MIFGSAQARPSAFLQWVWVNSAWKMRESRLVRPHEFAKEKKKGHGDDPDNFCVGGYIVFGNSPNNSRTTSLDLACLLPACEHCRIQKLQLSMIADMHNQTILPLTHAILGRMEPKLTLCDSVYYVLLLFVIIYLAFAFRWSPSHI